MVKNIFFIFTLLLPILSPAIKPVSVVFKHYHENVKILKNNTAIVSLSFSTTDVDRESIMLPLQFDYAQIADASISPQNKAVSVSSVDGKTYLNIKNIPASDFPDSSKQVVIKLKINNVMRESGFLFKNKTLLVPVVSNYPDKNKNNIFIDDFTAGYNITSDLKINDPESLINNADFRIHVESTYPDKQNGTIRISAGYLNLHSINPVEIQFSYGFNSFILMAIIVVLLALYLIYFSNLLSFKDSGQGTQTSHPDFSL